MEKYSVIDLFAGAGGLSLGFMQTGKYEIKVAFENNPDMQATYKKNHPNVEVMGNVCDADYALIKKKYGEKMMHLCRELFPTILDKNPGVLSEIIIMTFASNRKLYDDIVKYNYEADFRNYIYGIYENLRYAKEDEKGFVEDPVTLLKQVGYTLYECKTEEDIQKFKKYYAKGEELCTFKGGRLNRCYVYFAVRDGADKLKRGDFPNPNRQDEYGTSVISIQFTRDSNHTLSIKNR